MFLPENVKDGSSQQAEEKERQEAYVQVEKWTIEMIPESVRTGVQISVQEVQCGDPDCAPIDTAIAILFPSGGRGMTGLPMTAKEVTKEHIETSLPPKDVLMKWSRGEEAEWPPIDDDEDLANFAPDLRFVQGQAVECRIGPDPVTGWAKGEVIQLWYREPGWPEGSFAPYKIKLEDGKNIFAPADLDHVIRAQK